MRVRTIEDKTGIIHAFYCEGCGMLHSFDQRWSFNGDYDKPTFSPSLLVRMGSARINGVESDNYVCHSFVRNGTIEYLSDCSHKLAGKTVELMDEETWFLERRKASECDKQEDYK